MTDIIDGIIVRVMESWPLQLVINTSSGPIGVILTEETRITQRGIASSPTELMPGEKVRLLGFYKPGHPETFHAVEIQLHSDDG